MKYHHELLDAVVTPCVVSAPVGVPPAGRGISLPTGVTHVC